MNKIRKDSPLLQLLRSFSLEGAGHMRTVLSPAVGGGMNSGRGGNTRFTGFINAQQMTCD